MIAKAEHVKGDPKRKGNWFQTYTGKEFYPIDPRAEDIDIIDIAAALSKLCRYAGHCLTFYSVAEHSVLLAQQASPELRLTALLHDASEAYLVDVPRPVKPNLVGYDVLETRLMTAISQKYGTVWPLPDEVHSLDMRILNDERIQNMAKAPREWGTEAPALGVDLQFWQPRDAMAAFVSAFVEYGGKLEEKTK